MTRHKPRLVKRGKGIAALHWGFFRIYSQIYHGRFANHLANQAAFANHLAVMTSQARDTLKRSLKKRGWTHLAAAKALGVSYEHLNRVLNGHRESASLLGRIKALPIRKKEVVR